MLQLTLFVLLSLFATYGLYHILSLLLSDTKCCHEQYIIIKSHNQEDEIEGIIRSLIHKYPNSEIIIVDEDSADSTHEILNKLCRDYPNVHTVNSHNFIL